MLHCLPEIREFLLVYMQLLQNLTRTIDSRSSREHSLRLPVFRMITRGAESLPVPYDGCTERDWFFVLGSLFLVLGSLLLVLCHQNLFCVFCAFCGSLATEGTEITNVGEIDDLNTNGGK